MGSTDTRPPRRPSLRTVSVDRARTDSDAPFHRTRQLYDTLATRRRTSRIFLPRNLPRPSTPIRPSPPAVTYVSVEPAVVWERRVEPLGCLWCRDGAFRFVEGATLLAHLKACHGRFTFSLAPPARRAQGEEAASIVVYMRLLCGPEGLAATRFHKFQTYDLESFYVNRRRYPRCAKNIRIPRPTSAEPPSADEPPRRRRPVRACTLQQRETPRSQRRKRELDESHELWNGHSLVTGLPMPEAAARKKARARKAESSRPVLAYENVQEAIAQKRLFHSVLQSPLCLSEFLEGADSDCDDGTEPEWRLKLANKEVHEYIDTISIEKLFMNLWNQFLLMEYFVYADRRVAPACLQFVKKYRRILQRMNLEVTFLRHLTEMSRLGLMDADSVYRTVMVLQDRDPEPKSDLEKDARYLFAEELERSAKREAEMDNAGPSSTQSSDTDVLPSAVRRIMIRGGHFPAPEPNGTSPSSGKATVRREPRSPKLIPNGAGPSSMRAVVNSELSAPGAALVFSGPSSSRSPMNGARPTNGMVASASRSRVSVPGSSASR